MENRNPLRVYCKNCGASVGFDIVRQTYACANCGELTGIQENKEAFFHWRTLQKQNHAVNAEGLTFEEYSCPACGAQIVFGRGEASETCDFCGGKLIRKELAEAERMPELIIPFFITPEEARKRMLEWGNEHENTPEGRSIVSNMGKFQGYYLPYYVIRGPVYGTVTRDGNNRTYSCAGYLEGTAVNLSQQMDNRTLDGMTPFDWSAARPFEYGYIAGHHVKLSDISEAEADRRIREKATEDFLPEVERVMQSSGVCVQVETGNISAVPALLPVYFIKSGKLTAVMNGQTGRISVSKQQIKKTNPWMIEPFIYTMLATFLTGYFYHFALEPMLLSCFVFGCLFFTVMSEGRNSLIRRITLRSEVSRASRESGKLKIEERKDGYKDSYDNTPVFYEKNREGKRVPVQIRFYSFGRWLQIALNIGLTVFLPAILAAFVRWIYLEPGETFCEGYRFLYGAAWYVLAGFIAVLYLVKGLRRDIYNHPILYELLPGRKRRLIGTRSDRKIGILSMFGIGQKGKNGKRLTIVGFFGNMGVIGIFLAALLFLVLIGSTASILL